ncbi:flagellar basal body P-ring formation protein FlgA [Vibrio fluvialis]|nr:flagellar basal body P-ring formation protein FlgA [Vibrio fluvialis]MBY8219981.1 flagellar basal body P-ring formation protein FlgA [Vibrio fluvialis]
MLMLALLLALPVAAQESRSEMQIRHAVQASLDEEIAQLAAQREWPPYQAQWQLWIPGAANHLPECQAPLLVTGRDNQLLPVGHLKRMVRCEEGDTAWRINVTIKASLTLPVVVTQTALARGGRLEPSMMTLEDRTLTRQDDFFTRIDEASGLEVNRRLRAGQILDPTLVSKPPLVIKGNQVVIIAAKDGVNASTKGVALEDGGRGDQIEVQNSASQSVVHAVVTGLNQVHTQF